MTILGAPLFPLSALGCQPVRPEWPAGTMVGCAWLLLLLAIRRADGEGPVVVVPQSLGLS